MKVTLLVPKLCRIIGKYVNYYAFIFAYMNF